MAMDPEGLNYAVRTPHAIYIEPNPATVALVASMTEASPAVLSASIRPYTSPAQPLGEAITAVLHLERVEPMVSREPYMGTLPGILGRSP